MPKISVLLPVYNGEKYLKEAIQSVLDQTLCDFELIIINDGSNDGSLEIINSFSDNRIVLINQENKGLAKALNVGIKLANGEYIARMDADDICMPNRFSEQYQFLNKNKDHVLVGSNAEIIEEEGFFLFKSKLPLENESIVGQFPNNNIFHSSVLIRSKVLKEIGGYSETINMFFEDLALWYKIARIGKIANLPNVLLKYRIVKNGLNLRIRDKEVHKRIEICILKDTVSDEERLFFNSLKKKKGSNNRYNVFCLKHHLRNRNIFRSILFLLRILGSVVVVKK